MQAADGRIFVKLMIFIIMSSCTLLLQVRLEVHLRLGVTGRFERRRQCLLLSIPLGRLIVIQRVQLRVLGCACLDGQGAACVATLSTCRQDGRSNLNISRRGHYSVKLIPFADQLSARFAFVIGQYDGSDAAR